MYIHVNTLHIDMSDIYSQNEYRNTDFSLIKVATLSKKRLNLTAFDDPAAR